MRISNRLTLCCFAILLGFALTTSEAMAQRGGGGGGGRQRGDTSAAQLLRSSNVKSELDLSEDQVEQVDEMLNDRGGMDRDALRAEFEGLSNEERIEKFREMREEQTTSQQKKLEEILLPHQMERLEQIVFQYATRNGASSNAFVKALDLNPDQVESLKEAASKMNEELAKEVAELRKEKMDEMLKAELTSSQYRKYQELTGDPYEAPQRNAGGRDQGGRGGNQGGGRGGRGGGGDQGGGRGGRGGGGDQGGGRGGRGGGGRGSDF